MLSVLLPHMPSYLLTCSCLPPFPQEFNELIGLEAKIATEERLVVNQEGNKLVVKVRAPFKAAM